MSKKKSHDPYLNDDDCTCEIAFTGHCKACRSFEAQKNKKGTK